MAKTMKAWGGGLFAGGLHSSDLQDNLGLERWFKNPKSHERRIHGHAHAGVRIVRDGPTLMLVLDAHLAHPAPFTEEELRPYVNAKLPPCQIEAMRRHTIMRRARSTTKRPKLLAELERRFRSTS